MSCSTCCPYAGQAEQHAAGVPSLPHEAGVQSAQPSPQLLLFKLCDTPVLRAGIQESQRRSASAHLPLAGSTSSLSTRAWHSRVVWLPCHTGTQRSPTSCGQAASSACEASLGSTRASSAELVNPAQPRDMRYVGCGYCTMHAGRCAAAHALWLITPNSGGSGCHLAR